MLDCYYLKGNILVEIQRYFQIKIVEIMDIISSFINSIEYVQWRFRDSVCGIKHPQE